MTDFHQMSSMMKNLFPSDPVADRAALKQMANAPVNDAPPTKDYVTESVDVPTGSMPLGIDSIYDFAKLAGVTETQKTGSAGQAKGSDPMPSTSKPSSTGEQPHPLKDKLVGEDDELFEPVKLQPRDTDPMAVAQQELQKGVALIQQGSAIVDAAQKKIEELTSTLSDRTLTKGEEREKERIVKGMKKSRSDFEDRYGDDAEAVMYATATKRAKNESIKDELYKALNDFKR